MFGRFRTLPWAAGARLAGVRCIVAAERSAANRWSDRLGRRGSTEPLVTAYVTNSELAARNLRGDRGRGRAARSTWCRTASMATASSLARSVATAAPSLLCVGNITANKGQGVLLEAVRLLRPRHPGLRAMLVGRDFTDGRFAREAEARGLRRHVHGRRLPRTTCGLTCGGPPCVVLPTLHREGMPTSLLEAMKAGVPVVASRVGGVSEIVEDGRDRRPRDSRRCAGPRAAPWAACSRTRPRGRGSRPNARRWVLERHGMSVMVEGHRTAFRDSLLRAARAPNFPAPPAEPPRPATVAHVTTADVSLRYLLQNQLEAIRERGYEVTGVSSPGPDVAALEAAGLRHEAVPMTRRITPVPRTLVPRPPLSPDAPAALHDRAHPYSRSPASSPRWPRAWRGVPVVVNTLHGFYFHEHTRPWPAGSTWLDREDRGAVLGRDPLPEPRGRGHGASRGHRAGGADPPARQRDRPPPLRPRRVGAAGRRPPARR